MQTYAQVLTFAIPFFLVLILIEYAFALRMGRVVIRSFDTVSSLSSGLTNSIKEVLGLAVVIVSYGWLESHLGIYEIKNSVLLYVLTFVGLDFAGYWAHRFEHQINVLWNRHVIHHSSEEFNLACALRQNISAIVGVFFFLLVPLALIGVPGEIIAVIAPLHLFAQFWYHTRLIDKMGWLEYIIVTPSHHRVHHAINDAYMDRNFSQVFIIWDRIFGTFQEELEAVPAVYGVRRQANTWNPFVINFQHIGLLISDAWHTSDWLDKFRVFYKPTGWRPDDVLASRPVPYTEDETSQVKYSTTGSKGLHIWIWLQMLIIISLMLHWFTQLGSLSVTNTLLYAGILSAGIFSYCALMDGKSVQLYGGEALKFILIVISLYAAPGWFGLDEMHLSLEILAVGVLLFTMLVNFYFIKTEGKTIPINNLNLT